MVTDGKLAIAVAVVLFGIAVATLSLSDNARQEFPAIPAQTNEHEISVVGTASEIVAADLLVVRIGVETQEDTARGALESNSDLMDGTIGAILEAGIPQEDVSTSRFDIRPVYQGFEVDGLYTQELVGYRVTNTVTVETAMLDSAADIVDGAVGAGANRIDTIYFTLSPDRQTAIQRDLIEDAVLNAMDRAQEILEPLGHEIVGVKTVSMFDGKPYAQESFAFARADTDRSSTQLFAPDQTVATSVQVTFLIALSVL